MRDVLVYPTPFFIAVQKNNNQTIYMKTGCYFYVIRGYVEYTATATAGTRDVECTLVSYDGTWKLKLASNISVGASGTGEFILTRPFVIGPSNKFGLRVRDVGLIDTSDTYKFVGIGYLRYGDVPEYRTDVFG